MSTSDNQRDRQEPRSRYEASRAADITEYFGMIGQGFDSRVDLLTKIIGDAHHPSLGQYKERLLAKTISDFLPKRYAVGTGFVVFPDVRPESVRLNGQTQSSDPVSHRLSRQLDLIVYNTTDYPTMFKDDQFVVVLPEAVRSIVEVKGSLDATNVDRFMESMIDFGLKWIECDTRYRDWQYGQQLNPPGIFLMAFGESIANSGKRRLAGKGLREKIAGAYKGKLRREDYIEHRFPVVKAAYVWDNYSVTLCGWHNDPSGYKLGWVTNKGRFVAWDSNGNPQEGKDRTISDIVSRIHFSLSDTSHPLPSYGGGSADNRTDICQHRDFGFAEWLSGDDASTVTNEWRR